MCVITQLSRKWHISVSISIKNSVIKGLDQHEDETLTADPFPTSSFFWLPVTRLRLGSQWVSSVRGKQFVFLFQGSSHTMEERWASGRIIQICQWLTLTSSPQTESLQSHNPLYLAKNWPQLCGDDEEVHWLSIVLSLVITRVSGWSIAVQIPSRAG